MNGIIELTIELDADVSANVEIESTDSYPVSVAMFRSMYLRSDPTHPHPLHQTAQWTVRLTRIDFFRLRHTDVKSVISLLG